MSLKAIASHLVEIPFIILVYTVFDKISKKIETVFSIPSPESKGLKIEKKWLDSIS